MADNSFASRFASKGSQGGGFADSVGKKSFTSENLQTQNQSSTASGVTPKAPKKPIDPHSSYLNEDALKEMQVVHRHKLKKGFYHNFPSE